MPDISIDELFSSAAPLQATQSVEKTSAGDVSLDDLFTEAERATPKPPPAINPTVANFVINTENTLGKAAQTIGEDPLKAIVGAGKSAIKGAVSIADLIADRGSAAISAVTGGSLDEGSKAWQALKDDASQAAFLREMDKTTPQERRMGAESTRTKIFNTIKDNIDAQNPQEQATDELMGLIPKGIQAAGDTVFTTLQRNLKAMGAPQPVVEVLSSAAGATASTALMFESLKPGAVAGSLSYLKDVPGRVQKGITKPIWADVGKVAFDEQAIIHPEIVAKVADKVKPVDPELAKAVEARGAKVRGRIVDGEFVPNVEKEVAVGEAVAKADIVSQMEQELGGPAPMPDDIAAKTVVKDSSGEPITLYHGTAMDFKDFDPEFRGSSTAGYGTSHGYFFTSNVGVAEQYAKLSAETHEKITQHEDTFVEGGPSIKFRGTYGENIRPVHLDMRNPLRITAEEMETKDLTTEDIVKQAKKEGKDGVIIEDVVDSPDGDSYWDQGDHYVVFKESQIHSALDATGTKVITHGPTEHTIYQNGKPLETFTTRETADVTAQYLRANHDRGIPPELGESFSNSAGSNAEIIDGPLPMANSQGVIPRASRDTFGSQLEDLDDNMIHEGIIDAFHSFAVDGLKPDSGKSLQAHRLLELMVKNAPPGPVRDSLVQLRTNVPNVKIRPYKGDLELHGQNHGDVAGMYDPATQTVYVGMGSNMMFSQVVFHELVHAATYDFVRNNPSHPLSIELQTTLNVARARFEKMAEEAIKNDRNLGGAIFSDIKTKRISGMDSFYGLNNVAELMAEVKSNPKFQILLMRSEQFKVNWEKLKTVYNSFADIIGKMLGFNKSNTGILHNILDLTDKIMVESAKTGGKGIASDPVAMARSKDPVVYKNSDGSPVRRSAVEAAFRFGDKMFNKVPGANLFEGKVKEYFRWAAEKVNPELLGPRAQAAAAATARAMARQMQKDSSNFHQSDKRRMFWFKNEKFAKDFVHLFELGAKFKDPVMNAVAEGYREWNRQILAKDTALGIKYEPLDNYIYHTFEDQAGVARYMEQKYGSKWGDPSFTKERSFELYQEAINAGFKPKYTNPEDIMLARQHASDVAAMRVETLRTLEEFGLAIRTKSEKVVGEETQVVKHVAPPAWNAQIWKSPSGESYLVHDQANVVLKNAFNSKSLWTVKGPPGDLFRGMMYVKNTIVPIRLALSLFHPLHVATIDNATAIVRASKLMLAGQMSPARWLVEMAKGATYAGKSGIPFSSLISNPRMGNNILKVWRGTKDASKLTEFDLTALQYMIEGGMIPDMSSQFRTNALRNFREAVARQSITAVFKLPFAMIDAMQKPMFDYWIPQLKIASYLKDVQTAMLANPELINNPKARIVAFRKLAKSVDNRYGEMAYSTLFMDRMVKDIAVANTLSLGWQMGFTREYGGGMLDATRLITHKGSIKQKAITGDLDRPMFALAYSTQALMYGALITFAAGAAVKGIHDMVYPQTGGVDADGKPNRANTMFFTREFASIYDHMEKQGIVDGLGHIVSSKASGVIGLTAEVYSGKNSFGEEIRNPDGTLLEKTAQSLHAVFGEVEPISLQNMGANSSLKDKALAVAGFTKAPKYATDTDTEAAIKDLFRKYGPPQVTNYEKVILSANSRKLKDLYEAGKDEEYDKLLDKITTDNELTGKEVRALEKRISSDAGGALEYMFSRIPWQRQKLLLDKMTPEERDRFIDHSNATHLRNNYNPPGEQ